jgi:hypothetical protein
MYAYDNFKMGPVEKFEGHEDTVKEFVWRRGSAGRVLAVSSRLRS